jgi:hypothetical protein
MELLIALVLIVALGELKEWRQERRAKTLSRQVRAFARALSGIKEEIKVLEGRLGLMSEKADQGAAAFAEARQLSDEARAFADKASVDLATIVNEYKINGVPLGLRRGNQSVSFDMVEGL